jgi:uncharacterized protein YegP (UPF0339 family)
MSVYSELLFGNGKEGLFFELYQDKAEEWRWRLKTRNGIIIATSHDGHKQKQNAEVEILFVQQCENAKVIGSDGLVEDIRKNLR